MSSILVERRSWIRFHGALQLAMNTCRPHLPPRIEDHSCRSVGWTLNWILFVPCSGLLPARLGPLGLCSSRSRAPITEKFCVFVSAGSENLVLDTGIQTTNFPNLRTALDLLIIPTDTHLPVVYSSQLARRVSEYLDSSYKNRGNAFLFDGLLYLR